MEKVKCIEYRGIRDLVAAEVTTDTTEKFECGTPFSLAWTSELTKEVEASSESHFYDNVPAIIIDAAGADTVGVNVSAVPPEVVAKITGQDYDETTGMFAEGEPISKYYAIGYVTEDTDHEEYFVWRLKGKFSIPSETHASKNDGTDASGQELTYTGINTTHKFNKFGKSHKAITLPKSKCPLTEDKFFEKVQDPDTIEAAKTHL